MRLTGFLLVSLLTFLTGTGSSMLRSWLNPPDSIPVVTSQPQIPADTFITLERTGCYGTCPSYTVAVSADGTVIFHGLYFGSSGQTNQWKRSGVIKAHLVQEQVEQLLAAFDQARFFSLQDSYSDNRDGCTDFATDHSFAYTSIQIDGQTKSIRHYLGCGTIDHVFSPSLRDLSDLETKIDEIVNTKQWMPGAN